MNKTLNDVYGLSCNFGNPTILEGTNAATIKTTVATNYCIDGFMYTKAITDNIAMTACAQQAANTTCLYLISINAAGTVKITKGTEVLTADLSAGDAYLKLPEPSSGYIPIANMRIVLGATTFTSGTTDLGAANVTETFQSMATMPADVISS